MQYDINAGFKALGFDKELNDCLFICASKNEVEDLHIKFHLDVAEKFGADAVFFGIERKKYYNPQIYIYDFTNRLYEENELTELQKKVWSSGNVPIICVFFDTEVKIMDCTVHTEDNKPVFIQTVSLLNEVKGLYDKNFAIRVKTGSFWEEEENKRKFTFKNNSSYNILIRWVKKLRTVYKSELKDEQKIRVVNKIIIQSILIKYLEERKDENGLNLFQDKYFKEYSNAHTFVEVLENNENLISLLEKLHRDFNGNLFEWSDCEKEILREVDLTLLAKALNGYTTPECGSQLTLELIRYYEFSYVPVELISRLYEEFLGEDKHSKGLFYTPSHLAQLLIDEIMPLSDYDKIDFQAYKILDPACGSGIFLVLAFKRLVQWWRLKQSNFSSKPNLKDLKMLMNCIYGVDKEEQATKLAAFSLCLALCDELSPLQIITELHFEDLTQKNILYSDFFVKEYSEAEELYQTSEFQKQLSNYKKIDGYCFDLIIGNPPFRRSGSLKGVKAAFWNTKIKNEAVGIPSKQIALKFLSKALALLSDEGKICMIVKSSGFLYNTTAANYRKIIFQNYQVSEILDFTALARNETLWDNGAEVDTLAILITNQVPDVTRNVLHLTFRRTKSIKERIRFDVDDYDLHYVNFYDMMHNPYIWKINLLGGGRIKTVIAKLGELEKLSDYLGDKFILLEGESGANSLLNEAFLNSHIDNEYIDEEYKGSFKNVEKDIFSPPNILIKENIALPFAFNNQFIPFSNEIVCIRSINNVTEELGSIANYLQNNLKYLRFFVISTSSKALVYKNTAIKKEDIENLPYINSDISDLLTDIDKNIIDDVIEIQQLFLRNGENSLAVKAIQYKDLKSILTKYGECVSETLNSIFGQDRKFYLNSIIPLYNGSYIAAVFKYDLNTIAPNIDNNWTDINIDNLTEDCISSSLSVNRVVKIYEDNTIVFIKPNQYRYWLSSIGYRDADKCIVDLVNSGY